MKIADIAAHEKRLRDLADRIALFASTIPAPPDRVTRREFEAGERVWLEETPGASFFARSFWGPAKELATRGRVEAPPLDAIPPDIASRACQRSSVKTAESSSSG